MEDKVYELNLFKVPVTMELLVTASNPKHAIARVQVLLEHRITQYVHPEDTPPQFKVIGLVEKLVTGVPVRKIIVERHSERPPIDSTQEGS